MKQDKCRVCGRNPGPPNWGRMQVLGPAAASSSRSRLVHSGNYQAIPTGQHRARNMSVVAARCLRAIPAVRSMIVISGNSPPSANAAAVALLLPRSSAGLVGRLDGVAMDALAWSTTGDGSLEAAVPTMEAVNRNARRPKKVRTNCSSIRILCLMVALPPSSVVFTAVFYILLHGRTQECCV